MQQVELTQQRLAWTVILDRLRKAMFADQYDRTVEAVAAERAQSREKQLAGPAGHARTQAKAILRRRLASWLDKHIFDARHRLSHGVAFVVSEADLPDRFVERELINADFDRWLDFVEKVNGRALAVGKNVWEKIGGPEALERGDLSFSLDEALLTNSAFILYSGSCSQGAVVGEVMDSEDEGGDDL
ncbi:hypothetical protein SLS56_011849 [Neofusicoccum ribis]|uniref:Uncharacterized protein n=1 Tax=Neofusicoccum ribis TaxID=45134 RepID=A0ABR3SAI1_9PEZI